MRSEKTRNDRAFHSSIIHTSICRSSLLALVDKTCYYEYVSILFQEIFVLELAVIGLGFKTSRIPVVFV